VTEMRFKMRWGMAVGSCVGFESAFSSYFGEAAMSIVPGLFLFFTVMSLNFLGDWLRDRLDPRLRQID